MARVEKSILVKSPKKTGFFMRLPVGILLIHLNLDVRSQSQIYPLQFRFTNAHTDVLVRCVGREHVYCYCVAVGWNAL